METEPRTIALGRYDANAPTVEIIRHIGSDNRVCRFRLDCRQPSQRYIAECLEAFGWYEYESVQAMIATLRDGDAFFDVGAHVGYFSIIARALVGPRGYILAFEPSRQNNAALIAARIATVQSVVVSDRCGMTEFFSNLDNDGGHSLWNPGNHPFNERTRAEGAPSTKVETVFLDMFKHVMTNAIKIDTEGAEMAVLRGAREILAQPQLKLVICENNKWGRKQLGETGDPVEFMRQFGFTTAEEDPGRFVGNYIFTR